MNAPIRSYCQIGLLWAVVSVGIVGCGTTTKPEIKPVMVEPKFTGLVIEQGPGSLGAETRKERVTCLILHHTAGSLPSSLDILQGKDPKHKVGVHYLVTDEPKPRVLRMVPEYLAAYHAGKSAWGKLTNLNQSSIGIEIINYDGNVYPYSDAQAEIIFALCDEIIRRHDICLACEHLKDNACSLCGCPVSRVAGYVSKLSWADQECPAGKWGKATPQ